MKKSDKVFVIFLKVIYKAPFWLWCIASLVVICVQPIAGIVPSLGTGVFVFPWTLFGRRVLNECEESRKFNHRM